MDSQTVLMFIRNETVTVIQQFSRLGRFRKKVYAVLTHPNLKDQHKQNEGLDKKHLVKIQAYIAVVLLNLKTSKGNG